MRYTKIRISIHAPREGSDLVSVSAMPITVNFYPRSPRGERHPQAGRRGRVYRNFYPRSPRGERHRPEKGDRPAGRISIHAPREGSDVFSYGDIELFHDFYPRSPRGERRNAMDDMGGISSFLSTLPARGATYSMGTALSTRAISIHAPREGSDSSGEVTESPVYVFLSTLPARGATRGSCRCPRRSQYFYPRSPRGERLVLDGDRLVHQGDFYPRSPRGERRRSTRPLRCRPHFYPRSPRGERHLSHCQTPQK